MVATVIRKLPKMVALFEEKVVPSYVKADDPITWLFAAVYNTRDAGMPDNPRLLVLRCPLAEVNVKLVLPTINAGEDPLAKNTCPGTAVVSVMLLAPSKL